MFSAVGWLWIQDAEYPDEFGDPASVPRPQTIEAVLEAVERLAPDPEAALFRQYNGAHTLLIDRHHNHRGDAWPIELFREVARVAPGSFGFLHTYDDEHLEEQYRFMKWTMVQGRITVEEDRALTPVVRTWYDGRDPRTTD